MGTALLELLVAVAVQVQTGKILKVLSLGLVVLVFPPQSQVLQ
jgi:hypothetical protein